MTYTEIPDPDDMGLIQTWFLPWSSPSLKAQATQKNLTRISFQMARAGEDSEDF